MRVSHCVLALSLLASSDVYAEADLSGRTNYRNDFTIEQSQLKNGVGCVATLSRSTPSGPRTYRAILRDLKTATEAECKNVLTSTQPIVVRENVDHVEAASLLDAIDRCLSPDPNNKQKHPEISQNDQNEIRKLLRDKVISSIDYRYSTFSPWAFVICDNYELGGVTGCSVLSFRVKEGKLSDVRVIRIVD